MFAKIYPNLKLPIVAIASRVSKNPVRAGKSSLILLINLIPRTSFTFYKSSIIQFLKKSFFPLSILFVDIVC